MGQGYVIGDLQGCYGSLLKLLDKLNFDDSCDKLYLCGDIVARGEDSLASLRLVKQLSDKGVLQTVLGNHDITLIAAWLGVIAPKPKDKTLNILEADDCDELLNWLRRQPFLLYPDDKHVIVHAGIPPNWRIAQAARYAKELQVQFMGSRRQLSRLIPHLYHKDNHQSLKRWHDDRHGFDKMCMISDYLTRMRLCSHEGVLDFAFKSGLDDDMPAGFRPWFEWQVVRERKILFGHWAALQATIDNSTYCALDGGCVWGGRLVAYRLGDGVKLWVDC